MKPLTKHISVLFLFLILAVSCSTTPSRTTQSVTPASPHSAAVVFLSDFGILDESVAVCKGVMLGIEPELHIVDITHNVPAFSVNDAARILANTTAYFPPGTVFLGLVEKHSAAKKRPLVVKSKKGHWFVVPDNGLITLVGERDGIEEIREITSADWVMDLNPSVIFPGRSLYSPVAAHLARGEDWKKVGPVVEHAVKLDLKNFKVSDHEVAGEVVALDGPFGNLLTNVTATTLLTAGYGLGENVPLSIGGKDFSVPFVKTFDDVPVNQLLLYIDSTDHVAIAINQGNFASKYKVKASTKLVIKKKTKHS